MLSLNFIYHWQTYMCGVLHRREEVMCPPFLCLVIFQEYGTEYLEENLCRERM